MQMEKGKVFLGGTCNESKWREKLISLLNNDRYFNPIVQDWTHSVQENEKIQKQCCQYHLYVITPLMTGCFSIAEAVDDSNKIPERTLFCILKSDEDGKGKKVIYEEGQLRSLNATSELLIENGARCFNSLQEIADFLNQENYQSARFHNNYIEK